MDGMIILWRPLVASKVEMPMQTLPETLRPAGQICLALRSEF